MADLATPDLLTRRQVARRLDISPERVRQLALAGQLPFLRTPLGRLYSAADVEAYAQKKAERGATVAVVP